MIPGAEKLFALDLRSLALCRILTGLTVMGDLVVRAFDFRMHYTDQGILPREALYELRIADFPSLYNASSWEVFIAGLFVCHGLSAFALTLGYRTRLFSVLVWYLTLSLQQRNFLVNNGGDLVLVALLLFGIFLPWGEAFSLDSRLRGRSSSHLEGPVMVRSAATTVVILQLVMIYWLSVFHKMEPTWLSGEAVYYALTSDFYARPSGHLLLPYPQLLKGLTVLTFAWELVAPLFLLLAFPRLRIATCLLLALMHLSFGVFLRIGIFAFSPLLYLGAMLPSEFWSMRVGASLARVLNSVFLGERETRVATPLRTLEVGMGENKSARGAPGRLSVLGSAFLYLVFSYALLHALGQDPRIGRILPESVGTAGKLFGVEQRWTVFVNLPLMLNGWIVVEGRLANGDVVDLFQDRRELSWVKPSTLSTRYTSFRWPTPLVVIVGSKPYQPWFVKSLAKDWERRHPNERVVWARLNLMRQKRRPDFQDAPPRRNSLWEGTIP